MQLSPLELEYLLRRMKNLLITVLQGIYIIQRSQAEEVSVQDQRVVEAGAFDRPFSLSDLCLDG